MYIRNFSRSGQSNDGTEDRQHEAAVESQKRRIQMDLLVLDSDKRKLVSEKGNLDLEIRKLKQDSERIRVMLDSKTGRMAVVTRELSQKEEEERRLQKKLNTL